MPEPTSDTLRSHEKRIAGMLADPECVGDLLLVGLVFARSVDLGDPPLDTVVRAAAASVYGAASHPGMLARFRWEDHPRVHDQGTRRVRDVLASDIRRYAPNLARAHTCQRPVTRRPRHDTFATSIFAEQSSTPAPAVEQRCGRSAHTAGEYLFVDAVDGSRTALGACSQARCLAWWQAMRDANQAELAAHPPPEPAANRGGVLERHLDEIDWPKLYQHLDPRWEPPHEAPGWRPPKLQILLTDEPDLDAGRATRPALTVVKGGWK